MTYTNFPNGISLTTATGAVDGQIAGNSATFATDSVLGISQTVTYQFASTSAAEVAYVPVPFDGNIARAFVISGATITVTTGFTVRVGSAGSIAVATVANTSGIAGGVSDLTTTTTAVTTVNSIQLTKANAGTTGAMTIGVQIVRA